MMFEIRVAWIGLFLLTLSAAVKQAEVYGDITGPMAILLCAHFLYANACVKGEECVPTTWDIAYEKWGWMYVRAERRGAWRGTRRALLVAHNVGRGPAQQWQADARVRVC